MIKWQKPANADLKLKNTNVRFSFLLLWRKKTLQSLDRAKEASGFVSKSNIFLDFDFTPGSARKAPRASISSCSRRNTRRTLSKRPSGRCSIVTEIRMMVVNYQNHFHFPWSSGEAPELGLDGETEQREAKQVGIGGAADSFVSWVGQCL